jgi:NRAMP (natural resistance-associated macrophage protein)-like metal ion transporter
MKRRPAGSLRSLWAQLRGWVSVLGPGLITGASDDDPSGISMYSIAGASTGYSMLWTAVLTTPMMAVVQGMCARIGLVCGCGLTTALGKRFPVVVVRVLVILVVLANTLNIGADIAGMGASAHLVFKPVPEALWSIGFVATMVAVEVFVAYGPFALIAKILCSALLAYVVTAFMVHVDWRMALRRAVIPEVHVTGVWISTFLGVLGTTITPYLFFWQTSLEVEERAKRQPKGTFQHDPPSAREIADAHADVNTGMAYSNLIMFFIIVTAAATLGAQHINIVTAQDAAAALRPLAGRFAELIFALGMVGAGLLAVPVLAGASAYAVAETFSQPEGLSLKPRKARVFYGIIMAGIGIGLLIEVIGVDPIRALFWSAVINGVVAVPLLAAITVLANDERVMGSWTNSRAANVWAILTILLMSAAAVGLFVFWNS